jgi:uncharacterized repeat protein (TIGR03803 family)
LKRRIITATATQHRIETFGINLRAATFGLALAIVFVLSVVAIPTAQAQSFNVIYNFTGGQDGGGPETGLTMDSAGNLYGTTWYSSAIGGGTVFKLGRLRSGWLLTPLHNFTGDGDGCQLDGRVIFGPDGSLYGTTVYGGSGGCEGDGYGTVFSLKPPPSVFSPWKESVLYRFTGTDGAFPHGDIAFDQSGNLYGTAFQGGLYGSGAVYQLSHATGVWTKNVLYTFTGGEDGGQPFGGVIRDSGGSIYGTTSVGGTHGYGTVFQLVPGGGAWTLNTLYNFQYTPDGGLPYGGLTFDRFGDLFGTASAGGPGDGGTVFELKPSGGNWTYSLVYGLSGSGRSGPEASLAIDAAGNLYGTTFGDGDYGYGSVFKLTPSGSSWTYTSLHDFSGGSDGAYSTSSVTFDTNGNLYGTAYAGGTNEAGAVFEITP